MNNINILNYKFSLSLIIKKLKIGTFYLSGRNNTGKICINHKCSGLKQNHNYIDFYRRINSYGSIMKILRFINFSAFLGLIFYDNGLYSYIIISEGLKSGDRIYSGSFIVMEQNTVIKKGYALPLKNYKIFTLVNNIEKNPFQGAIISRAAGTSSFIVGKNKEKIILKLRSGWQLNLSQYCISTVGYVSNMVHRYRILKKAGNAVKLGRRPTVRGVAKNPCDHPHGGGNGKKSKPVNPKSPWGWVTVGRSSKIKKKDLLKKKEI